MKNTVAMFILALLITGVAAPLFLETWIQAQPDYHIVDWRGPPEGNFYSISEALAHPDVNDGDIIYVNWGPEAPAYAEDVHVNKSVTIVGNNGRPIIDGGGKRVFNVTAKDVSLVNLEIRNGEDGIHLHSGAQNTNLTGNHIHSNAHSGLVIRSGDNLLRNNNLTGNTYNFRVFNFTNNDVDISNTVDGKPIYLWKNRDTETVPSDAGYVAVLDSTNIVVKDLVLSNNGEGVTFVNTTHSTITNVTATHHESAGVKLDDSTNIRIENVNVSNNKNSYGIVLSSSDNNQLVNNLLSNNYVGLSLSYSYNNIICGNTVRDSNISGIEDTFSVGNKFYHNNIVNNLPNQVLIIEAYEQWDNGANGEGNYWSDYQIQNPGTEDANGDGIWDTPYQVNTNNFDRCPLVNPWKSIRTFNVASDPVSGFDGFNITLQSNHVIASLNLTTTGTEKYPRAMTFNLTAGSSGYCNITLERRWLDGNFTLYVDKVQKEFDLALQNATHSYLCFTYDAGKFQIRILGTRQGMLPGDLNQDGKIDMRDIGAIARLFGLELDITLEEIN